MNSKASITSIARLSAAALLLAGWAASTSAHMTRNSLKVNDGAASLVGGSTATVKWNTNVTHNSTYKISYSKDNGATWTPVTTITGQDGSTGDKTYAWTVPTEATTQGKLRVNQSAQGEKANSPDNDYNVFASFAVTATTSIAPQAALTATPASMARDGEFIAVRFQANDARQASLEVYDLSGALQKTLDLGSAKAGENHLKVSAKEIGLTGKSVLRLRVGNRVVLEELISAK